jgi:hypothetical protein
MRKALIFLLVSLPAPELVLAHEDTPLTLRPNGTVAGLPAKLGPVILRVHGLGSEPSIGFQAGSYKNVLPSCLSKLIRSVSIKDVQLSGSWYHKESDGLPYYLLAEFLDPPRSSSTAPRSSFNIMFSLRTAGIIYLNKFIASPYGTGGHSEAVYLPKDCEVPVLISPPEREAASAKEPNNSLKADSLRERT